MKKLRKQINTKLSILICTVPSRMSTFLPTLLDKLLPQATKDVEIIWLGDNKKRTVGEKRNNLLNLAKGDYIIFVDDDDRVSDDYVAQLMNGIRSGADVVNFKVMCSVNGSPYKRVDYDATFKRDTDHADHYRRIPNHLMCTKRVLALQAGFPLISMSEDAQYAKKLLPLLKTQAFIDKVLYYYDFSHQISETQ